MKKLFLTSLFCILSYLTFSQKDIDIQLALEYYQNREFKKASELYEKIYKKKNNKIYFKYYLRTLYELKEFKKSEKLIKKQIKKDKNNESYYYVELGELYKKQNLPEKADENFNIAIKKVPLLENKINSLSVSFLGKREYKFAEKTYLYARKKFGNSNKFSYELASIYLKQRKYQNAVDEYLEKINYQPSHLKRIQNSLQNMINDKESDKFIEILQTSILKKIRKQPNYTIYNEFLIWVYIQKHNFEMAFIQTKAIDKRKNEKGKRLIDLANLTLKNKEYDISFKIYEEIVKKGKSNIYYEDAKIKMMEVLFQKTTLNGNFISEEEKINLENHFLTTISELGRNNKTVVLLKNLSYLKAFFMKKTDEAINLLEVAIKIPNISKKDLSNCKIQLADIYLLIDDIWEATLIYAQVESDNKNNPIGHLAKFKKAKLAYYTGDFQWAEAQLDVLKASTSKLIANDAFELSLLISDNIAEDTSEFVMKIFARADFLILKNQDSMAILSMDTILNEFKNHSLNDEILLKKAKIFHKKKNFKMAISLLEKIISDYNSDILSDNATFLLAQIYEKNMNNIEKAKKLYRKIITDYQDSIFSKRAKKKLKVLNKNPN